MLSVARIVSRLCAVCSCFKSIAGLNTFIFHSVPRRFGDQPAALVRSIIIGSVRVSEHKFLANAATAQTEEVQSLRIFKNSPNFLKNMYP